MIRLSQSCRLRASGLALLGLALCAAPAWARTGGPLPEGLPVGPVVLAPYVATSVGFDDNLFRVNACGPEDPPECIGPASEVFTRTSVGLTASVPVSNSLLDLRYQVDKRDYEDYKPRRPREQTLGGQFRINLGTGDTILVNDTFTRGASDVRIVDEGGELVFRDAPYDYNRAEIVWQRFRPSSPGFAIRLTKVELEFEADEPVPFFDYSGVETAIEYRHPTPGRRWLRLYFDTRRFDHYEPGAAVPREPFRQERAATLQAGMGGFFGRGHTFDVRLGYGEFRLLGTGAEFQGLVGTANMTLVLGGRTRVLATLWRRPLPSNFPTYYIVNSLRVSAERNVARNVMGGMALEQFHSEYLDPLPIDENQEIRKDQRYLLEGYLDWFVHERIAVRLAAGRQQRVSNFPDTEFTTTGVSLGLRLGWF